MPSFFQRAFVCSLVLILVLGLGERSFAANDKPIKMSEVARLVKDQSPQEVLGVMAERGVAFRVSASAVGRLEKFGFTEDQIELIRKIAAGEEVDLAGEKEDADDPEKPAEAGEFEVGFPDPLGWHNAEQKRLERAMEKAGLGYDRIELSRATLYCNANRARTLTPLLKKLEAALIKKFPESISNASSPQSAHIVIVDGASEWRTWVDALMDSYEQDGMKMSFGPEADPREKLTNGNGFLLPACAVAHADPRTEEGISRFATYSLGHLMMARAGGKKQPVGLTTGFGDLAEEMAMGTPSVMIYSYEKRDLKQEGSWRDVVRNLFNAKKIDKASRPWGYDTATMKPENYAECWSLVKMLSAAPDKFAQAVRFVREDGKAMTDAVTDAYEMDDKQLLKTWYKSVK